MRSEKCVGLLLAALLALSSVASAGEDGVRLMFFGDSGTGGPEQKALARQMRRFEHDLQHVFLLGDNVYFAGRAGRIRAAFHEPYARLIALRTPDGRPQVRFHAALGNHDVHLCEPSAGPDGLLAVDREAYAWREEGCDVEQHLADPHFGYANGRRYYDVAIRDAQGSVIAEALILDSNTLPSKKRPELHDTAQLSWLKQRLDASHAGDDPAGGPWRIVTLHNPLRTPSAKGYLFGRGGHEEDLLLLSAVRERFVGQDVGGPADPQMEAEVEPLLARGDVDVVFAGHNHFYARLLPDEDGVRHFVAGGGGIATLEPDLGTAPVAAGGGFVSFVTAVLTRERFEYCVIDSLGRVRDHGQWTRDMAGGPDVPLAGDRYDEVCGR